MITYTLITGILFGLFYALMGLGLNLIFGVMKIVNLAHGDFLMLAAYAAYIAYTYAGISPLITMALLMAIFLVVGFLLYYGLVPRLLRSEDPEVLSLLLFFGVSQVIEALAVLIFGVNPRTINLGAFGNAPLHLFGQVFLTAWWVGVLVSVVILVAVYLVLYKTRLGSAVRALMGNRDEAAASGVNIHRVSALAFGGGLATAGVAGALTPFFLGGIYPTLGVNLTMTSFAIIVIGSLGNPLGTVVGGLVYGLSDMLMQSYLPSWANLAPFALLLIILLLRPNGLLGKGARHA
ncbi:MAG: branched-chain amino acid ABC transporter permease [Alicyclobacillaceae bacterium]|nr:branched-chain amino acid ABC transporter permease [Alicyclobacillaceae bacterium]